IYSSLSVRRGSDTNYIRVLDVEPKPWNSFFDEAPLQGRLRVVSLRHHPPPQFAALSYCRGKPNKSRPYTIELRAKGRYRAKLNITENCRNALCDLRQRRRPLTIWVDSICISQSDIEEMQMQIPLMGSIYLLVAVVYVWLGKDYYFFYDRIMYIKVAAYQWN
ncbi:hypothetical protein K458DRAFT_285114, partial [Lentithecium fluviatile CBS 122367]